MVIEELAKIAFSDIRDVLTVDNGLRDISMLDEKTAKAISSIKITEDKSMGEVIGETKEVKLWDKLRALDSLGKHFGIFERDNSQKKTDNVTIFELPNNGRDKTD
jgi:phage terminase small subunit